MTTMYLFLVLVSLQQISACDPCNASSPTSCACTGFDTIQKDWFHPSSKEWNMGFWCRANTLEALVNYNTYNPSHIYFNIINDVITAHPANVIIASASGFYDDCQWWILAYLRAYELTKNDSYLAEATKVFDYVHSTAWDNACGGGVWWSTAKNYKNAITNELFLMASTKLFLLTKQQKYLDIAKAEWQWFEATGMINGQSLINDGLDKNCQNNNGLTWTYNQGVILGGLANLYMITNNSTLLQRIHSIASAVQTHLVTSDGVLNELANPSGDALQFKGVFVRYLRYAQDILQQGPTWNSWLAKQAQSIALRAYDSSHQVFGVLWQGPLDSPGPVTQTSAIDAFNSATQ